MRTIPLRAALVAAVALAVVAGCSSSGSSPAASATGGRMTVTGAWARETPPVMIPSGAYMTITNGTGSDDALVSASSPAAASVEVHEIMVVATSDPMTSTGFMMGMQPVARLPIPAGGTVELKPGSYHLMLIDLKEPLKAGSTIEITLTFEKAPPVTVTAEVRVG